MKTVFFITFFAVCSLFSQTPATLIKLPLGSVIIENNFSGNTWLQSGYINVTYVYGVRLIYNCLEKQGWRNVQIISMGKNKNRQLAVFQKNSSKITVMIWSEKSQQD